MAKKRKKQLKPNERVFIYEYAKTFNASAAYRKAFPDNDPKYAKHYGNRLKNRPDIVEEVKRAVEEAVGPMEKDLKENIEFWRGIRDNPEEKTAAKLKASEYLAKYQQMFTDKKEIDVNVSAVNIIEDI